MGEAHPTRPGLVRRGGFSNSGHGHGVRFETAAASQPRYPCSQLHPNGQDEYPKPIDESSAEAIAIFGSEGMPIVGLRAVAAFHR